jgi:hypothetical protein
MFARSKMHAFNSIEPRSGSEQFIYIWSWKTGKEEPGSRSRKLEAAQRNGQEDPGTEIYIEKGI